MSLQSVPPRPAPSSNGNCLGTALYVTGKILLGAGSWAFYLLGKTLSLTATGVGFVAAQGFKMLVDANNPVQQGAPLRGRAQPRLAPAAQVPSQAYRDAFVRHLTASFGEEHANKPSFKTALKAFEEQLPEGDFLSQDDIKRSLAAAERAYRDLASASQTRGNAYLGAPAAKSAQEAIQGMRIDYCVEAPARRVSTQEIQSAFQRHLTAAFGQHAASSSFTTASRTFDALLPAAGGSLSSDEIRNLLERADQSYDQLGRAAKQPGTLFLNSPACASAKAAVQAMRAAYLTTAPFDPNFYQQQFARCFQSWDNGGRDAASSLNGEIYAQTMQDIQEQKRFSPQKFAQMVRRTRHISTLEASQMASGSYQRPSYTTKVQFINQSTFDAAADMIAKGLNPLVLNMANKTDRGGAPKRASAQEETLCRQSALIESLNVYSQGQDHYPTPIEGGILSPQVPVFRHGPDKGYAYRAPFYVDVLACAAYNCNINHGRGYDKPATAQAYELGTKEKMRLMARVAIANGNDSLLLSAFGCGAFQNDPTTIAKWYTEVLNENEFRGVFKNITFAIIDMGSTRNLDTFRQTMHGQLKDASFV